LFDQRAGRDEDIAIDRQIRRALAAFRDQQARQPARQRGQDHQPGEMDWIAVAVRGEAGDDGAEENGEKGAAFDQRVAGRQFAPLKQVRQDAVFDRAEQRGQRPEHEHRKKQQRERVKGKPGDRDDCGADFGQLDPLGYERFVVAVGQLAAEARQKEKRRDQGGAGNRDQNRRIRAGHFVQDDEDQRGFQKIIAEGGEELAPKQRRETARRHQ
jgi:hypothetical protein